MENIIGRYLLEKLRAAGRDVRVHLDDPELICRIEIPPGPALVYARKIPGAGGLPPNTGGRMMCLLSGGFDSNVAASKMMKRGSHVTVFHSLGGAARMPVFRPLVGDRKLEILALARRIGTYDISAEPFHDCCPVFMPRAPALHTSAEELARAEATLDIAALVHRGVETATIERFRYVAGRVEQVESLRAAKA